MRKIKIGIIFNTQVEITLFIVEDKTIPRANPVGQADALNIL
jgi:hypothetical protein